MKWIQRALVALVLLGLVLVGGGLLLSPKFHIERSVLVQAAPEKAYALVSDPHRWKEWTVWNRRDPAMSIEYFGAASGDWSETKSSGGRGVGPVTRAPSPRARRWRRGG